MSADTGFGFPTVVLVSTVTALAPGESGGAGVGAGVGKENGGLWVNKSLVIGIVLGGGILVTVVVVLGVFLWGYRRREASKGGGGGTEGTELSTRDAEIEHVL